MPRHPALYAVKKFLLSKTLLLVAMAIVLLVSLYKDVANTPAMPGDMRNRIVGSRIMKDGGSPYFYIWKEGDTVRYYDTYIAPNAIMSTATSTPFFHQVNSVIAESSAVSVQHYLAIAGVLFVGCLPGTNDAIGKAPQKHQFPAGWYYHSFYLHGWLAHTCTYRAELHFCAGACHGLLLCHAAKNRWVSSAAVWCSSM